MLVSSFPFAINWTQANVPAILHMAHASQDEGTALAKVLFGDYTPGGHLVETWPKSLDQLPPMMDYNIRDGRTYMYFKGEPLYPFGFGLSYTTFKYSNLRTSSPRLAQGWNGDSQRGRDEYRQPRGRRSRADLRKASGLEGGAPARRAEGVPARDGPAKRNEDGRDSADGLALAWWDEKLPGFRVEAEPVSVMVGNSSSDIEASTTVSVE